VIVYQASEEAARPKVNSEMDSTTFMSTSVRPSLSVFGQLVCLASVDWFIARLTGKRYKHRSFFRHKIGLCTTNLTAI
jgi:hypothetical protein